MWHLIWRPEAIEDLEEIYCYILRDKPADAFEVVLKVENTIDDLIEHPFMGKVGENQRTRELLVHKSYRAIYTVDEAVDAILILTVIHTSRLSPDLPCQTRHTVV